ncbi:BnaA03g60030D [Brassica napus]|uniref:BnaA03g60030D protein n=1 Tax=Brassica napus TaxID=3708 RepID=A0A078GM93_BRANA|nr:BnaA03g60030D [Brassica napus]
MDGDLTTETRKTLISQRTRISAIYHTSSNQNTRITTINAKFALNNHIPFFPIFMIILKTSVFIRGNLTFILPCGPSVNRSVVYGLLTELYGLREIAFDGLTRMHGLVSSRRFGRARRTLGRYVATEFWLELGRYIATERDGRSVVREIEFVAHSVDPAEADAHWVALCNVEEPPPKPWVPVRPFSERVVGRPSRCTLPFLGTLRSFCHIPENVHFRLPLEGERADEPPEGFFTLYEEYLMRAHLWFPIPSVILEFLNRLEVSISQISPRGIKHLVGLLVLGYERGIELTAEYLEAFLTLSRVGTDRLYGFRPRTFMEVLKGFSQGDRGWKSYFFYVRLDQASVAVECLPSFRRLWGGRR